jgi:hypothetical protein
MPDLVANMRRAKWPSGEGRQALPKAPRRGDLDGRETDAIIGTSPEAALDSELNGGSRAKVCRQK